MGPQRTLEVPPVSEIYKFSPTHVGFMVGLTTQLETGLPSPRNTRKERKGHLGYSLDVGRVTAAT